MERYQSELIKNIKKYRIASKLSQAKFAELCNVSTGTIGNIECGMAKPSFDLLITMARALDVTPAQLLTEESEENHNQQKIADHTLLLELYTKLKTHFQEEKK